MAIKLNVTKAKGKYDLGSSKFLGHPTLPSKWVNAFDNDTIFFLQIRLSDIKDLDKENKLPHEGYLYIFLDTAYGEYDLRPIVKYYRGEPTDCVNSFN